MSYKVELVEKKHPLIQLEASKTSIKNLFKDLLNETNGFMYQITLKVKFRKYEAEGMIEFSPVCFNSTTKIVMNHKLDLDRVQSIWPKKIAF